MKILEVRDSFVKFESSKKLALSSFVLISGMEKNYIAQIIQIKRAGENDIAYAKILFLYNGSLYDYDKTLPSIDSEISEFSFDTINKNFTEEKTLCVGRFADKESNLYLNQEGFNKKTLISIDSAESAQKLITSLAKQFENSIIIDTLGVFDGKKYIAGSDFKLPLNTASLDFMFEDCLSDATSDSKSLIKEIFQDLADYSKTVPFVPFGTLKAVVDDMVNRSHIFKLLVLKNKLAKFDKLGYFAADVSEAENLNKILTSKFAVIDLTKLDAIFQNRYMSVIYSAIEKQNVKPQIFVLASNTLDKKSLKKVLTGNLSTTFVSHSRFKYINEIKSLFENFIIEPTFVNRDVFKTYAAFLNSMQKEELLAVGKACDFLPLIFTAEEVEQEIIEIDVDENSLTEDELSELEEALEAVDPAVDVINKKSEDLIDKIADEVQATEKNESFNIFDEETEESGEDADIEKVIDLEDNELINETEESENEDVEIDEAMLESNLAEEPAIEDLEEKQEVIQEETSLEEFHTQVDEIQTIEIPEDISDLAEEAENIEPEVIEESLDSDEEDLATDSNEEEEEQPEEVLEVLPLNNNDDDSDFDVIVELEEGSNSEEDTIIIDFEDDDSENSDNLEREIIEDVDKVFTTMKEDSISDSDLDFIDELNDELEEKVDSLELAEGMEELTELKDLDENEDEGFIEPLKEINDFTESEEKEVLETRNTATPMVPVYEAEIPAEDLVESDAIEQGDTVVHAKYGNGIVEKMIKYGTKTLYSINFDNVGRRLLDPTLTEIKKA